MLKVRGTHFLSYIPTFYGFDKFCLLGFLTNVPVLVCLMTIC